MELYVKSEDDLSQQDVFSARGTLLFLQNFMETDQKFVRTKSGGLTDCHKKYKKS